MHATCRQTDRSETETTTVFSQSQKQQLTGISKKWQRPDGTTIPDKKLCRPIYGDESAGVIIICNKPCLEMPQSTNNITLATL